MSNAIKFSKIVTSEIIHKRSNSSFLLRYSKDKRFSDDIDLTDEKDFC